MKNRLAVLFLVVLAIFFCATNYASQQEVIIHTPSDFTPAYTKDWNRIDRIIDSSNRDILVYVAGFGGYDYIATRFTAAIDRAKARGLHVRMVVRGFSASWHALIVCHASSYQQQDILVFHIRAQGDTPDYSAESKQAEYNLMQGCVRLGIVNQQDIKAVQSGHEVWVYPDHTKKYKKDYRLKHAH